jgi:hypothetical protein
MIKCLALSIALLMASLAWVQPGAKAQGQDKATVCHIPPRNPANAHTIVVGEAAVPAHLAHGDLGECGGEGGGTTK